MKIRFLACLLLATTLLGSCKKLVEETQRSLLMDIITNGQWTVESYLEGTNSVTGQFEGYVFKFNEDGSVIGTIDSVGTAGTWAADPSNYSIMSSFPGSGDPLKKLNGTWKIKDSALDYVAAEMTTVNGKMILHLRKKA